jgi:glutathione S-transferase
VSSLILYGHHESGHAYKVALALAIAGIEYEYRWVDILAPRDERRADFRAVSKFGEVPVLVDAGSPMAQSNSILLHLARRFRRLGGETEERLSLSGEWLFWEANRVGFSLANLRALIRREFEREPSPEVIDWLRERLHQDVERLNAELSANSFLLGTAISVADISCSAYLFFADEAGVDLASWPSVGRWMERIRSQPGWKDPHVLMRSLRPARPST